MNITVAYVLISTANDIYTAQALMSIWSCRYYNPHINIVVVTDESTSKIIKQYPEFEKLINDIKVIDFDQQYSNFEKSRILKTQLRQLLRGDLLFVDTDTIFCAPIDEADFKADNIAMVEDIHVKGIATHPYRVGILKRTQTLFGVSINETLPYYNSGIIFYRDTPIALEFSKEWYNNWNTGKNKEGGKFDQPSLLYTISQNPHIIQPLNGIYNTQILGSVKYLFSGKILHFFNANWGQDSVHPFLDKKYYESVKVNKGLTERNKQDILNCKNLFSTTTFIIGPEDVSFWLSPEVRMLRNLNSSKLSRFLIKNLLFLLSLDKIIKHRFFHYSQLK